MYVNIAADTYEKVDAAVALVELLITSVSVCHKFLNLDTEQSLIVSLLLS